MRVVFLDIDGVLVTRRSLFGHDERIHRYEFDVCAVNMLLTAQTELGLCFVLSSSWRKIYCHKTLSVMTGLNIIDSTGISSTNRRGDEIQDWLNSNPNVSDYVIIDDEVSDLNDNQLNRTIKTEYADGFLFGHFLKLYELFGEKNE